MSEIKLYADGADFNGIKVAAEDTAISGFTTNPTLMRQAGVTDYKYFAQTVIEYLANKRPETTLSLEVFADEPNEIRRQARLISDWGNKYNYKVYVKIPVMYTSGEPTYTLVNNLANEGINLNVTAVFDNDQITNVIDSLDDKTSHILSIFAGRIADAGFCPNKQFVTAHQHIVETNKFNVQTLWASSREAYNYIDAQNIGANIITMPPDLIKKVKGFGKDLTLFSKETCQMFYNDAVKSGFNI